MEGARIEFSIIAPTRSAWLDRLVAGMQVIIGVVGSGRVLAEGGGESMFE